MSEGEQKEPEKSDDGLTGDEDLDELLGEVTDPLPADNVPAKKELPKRQEPIEAVPVLDEPEEDINQDIKVVLDKFHTVTDEILHNFKCDRDEISDAIDRMKNLLSGMNPQKPSPSVVEGYISAIKAKTDTNTNVIKMLDAFAKMISSTKGTSIFQNTTTSFDLTAILGEDDDDDDDDE
jgi:hypothetical protein